MTTDEMCEVLEQLRVPGMNTFGNEWDYDSADEPADCIVGRFFEPDITNIAGTFAARELFGWDDPITNSIRYALCDFMADAIRIWQKWDANPKELPDEVRPLWDECKQPGPGHTIEWTRFLPALRLLYGIDAWEDACSEVLDKDWDRYYTCELRFTIRPCDLGYEIIVQFGGNWQDVWAETFSFTVSRYATRADFIKALKHACYSELTEAIDD